MIEPGTNAECVVCANMAKAIKDDPDFEGKTARAFAYVAAGIADREIILFDAYVLRSERIRRRLFPARKVEAA